jgi:hypothetical protein
LYNINSRNNTAIPEKAQIHISERTCFLGVLEIYTIQNVISPQLQCKICLLFIIGRITVALRKIKKKYVQKHDSVIYVTYINLNYIVYKVQ